MPSQVAVTPAMTGGGSLPGEEPPGSIIGDVSTGLREAQYPLLREFVIKQRSSTSNRSSRLRHLGGKRNCLSYLNNAHHRNSRPRRSRQVNLGPALTGTDPDRHEEKSHSNDRLGLCIYRSFIGSEAVIH